MSDDLLRTYERTLDEYHKKFEIYTHPTDAKLYALMASYDLMQLPYLTSRSIVESPGAASRLKTLDDSLNYCLRWLFETGPESPMPTTSAALIDQAAQLLLFGADYADIADMHMMYGRDLVEVETNASDKSVKFRIKDEGTDTKEIHGFLQTHDFQRKIAQQNVKVYSASFPDLFKEISQIDTSLQDGRISIIDLESLNKPVFTEFLANELRPELLPFDGSADMGGFSFGEYEQFWRAISNWSHCILCVFMLKMRNGLDQLECVPTQLLTDTSFSSGMVILSGLPVEVVAKITERLTYTQGNKKAEILLQPLIRLNGKILWSPWVVRKSRYDRNMLKLMARTPGLKDKADDAIGARERAFLNLIGSFLSRRAGYQYKLTTDISDGDRHGEIDLVAYQTRVPTEILLVETKTLLAVDETNEISDATDKLIAAQEQILDALAILKSLPPLRRSNLFKFVDWTKVSNYYPIVMTPDCNPNTRYRDDVVPHISFASLSTYAKRRDLSKPSRLELFCRKKDWMKQRTPEKDYRYKDVRVGDITYRLPYIVIAKPDDKGKSRVAS